MPVVAEDPLARRVAELLEASGKRLATLETSAGGLLSARLVSVAGASAWFDRGIVAYSRDAKRDLAGLSDEVLAGHGVVSCEAAVALAEGLRAAAGVDYVVAESGIAGPQTGRRSAKPAGTVAIAVAGPSGTVADEYHLPGTRLEVMDAIAERCLEMLIGAIEGQEAAQP